MSLKSWYLEFNQEADIDLISMGPSLD